jgi:hypothetical protein
MSKGIGFRLLTIAGIVCLSFTGAFAKAYVGASAGRSSTEFDEGPGDSFSGSDTSFKLLGGYRVIKFFAVEADYRDLGSQSDTVAPGQELVFDTKAFDLFAVGVVPIGKAFEVFGKAGYSIWDADLSMTGTINGSGSEDGSDLAYGVGAAYSFNKFALRLEYEQFDIADVDNVSMASFGAEFRF